ncbi:MAG: type I-U CRISPR-associated protein Cas5/Cas6 [Acidobacteria bacterium]|nr:type I-U CRISPR-associated protein Cas5/Cas6 [Acidobacteriota bacterium]
MNERHQPSRTGVAGAPAPRPVFARFELACADRPPVEQTLTFGETVRRAAIRLRADTSHSESITGKSVHGVPLEGHRHACWLPVDEDGDGRIDHVVVCASGGFDPADEAALRSLRSIFRSGVPPLRIALVGIGFPDALSPVLGPAIEWRSATPFALPRFASRGAGKPPRPRDLPEAQLRRELANRSLPEPVAVEEIAALQLTSGRAVPWDRFTTERRKGSRGFGLAGFRIRFGKPVSGPVTLGFGSHFGLGLFLPVHTEDPS